MTMRELSAAYRQAAEAIAGRIRELKEAEKAAADPEQSDALRRRVAELRPLLREARELAELTAHYYERGYHRNGKYTV